MQFIIITLGIIFLLFYVALIGSTYNKEQQNVCVKNKNKICPSRLHVSNQGTFYRTNIKKCCKYTDQIKAINKFACLAEPGKSYNGIIITKEFKDNALRQQKYIQSLNSDGPID